LRRGNGRLRCLRALGDAGFEARLDLRKILRAEHVDAAPRGHIAAVRLEHPGVEADQALLSCDSPRVGSRRIAPHEDAEVIQRWNVLAQHVARYQVERLKDIVQTIRIKIDETNRAVGDLLVLASFGVKLDALPE
jgi:hypothetical protein